MKNIYIVSNAFDSDLILLVNNTHTCNLFLKS